MALCNSQENREEKRRKDRICCAHASQPPLCGCAHAPAPGQRVVLLDQDAQFVVCVCEWAEYVCVYMGVCDPVCVLVCVRERGGGHSLRCDWTVRGGAC